MDEDLRSIIESSGIGMSTQSIETDDSSSTSFITSNTSNLLNDIPNSYKDSATASPYQEEQEFSPNFIHNGKKQLTYEMNASEEYPPERDQIPPSKKRKRSALPEEIRDKDFKQPGSGCDEFTHFGRFAASMLRKMKRNDQLLSMRVILDVLNLGATEKLSPKILDHLNEIQRGKCSLDSIIEFRCFNFLI